jgi:hypothetical protein
MAFVPGYTHDVFVSYAHVDDRPFVETERWQPPMGWVTTLVRHLKNELSQKIGRDEAFSLWFDSQKLQGHHTLTDEIKSQLQRSAVFVAVQSPGYLASNWCRDEARYFTVGAAHDTTGRVFVVEKTPLDDEPQLAELSGRRNYRFWFRDQTERARTLGSPMPRTDELEYFRQVEDLAREIHGRLKAIRAVPGPAASRGKVTTGTPLAASLDSIPANRSTVMLAEVTDDLDFRRLEILRYLTQQGIAVLPQAGYPLGRAQFEEALTADLRQSRLFIQLLGPIPGKRPADIPEGYGWLQLQAARWQGIEILQWRSPEIDLETIEWGQHRELLEQETVQATSLESFKRAILSALSPTPPLPVRVITDRPLIFLNTEQRHQPIAAEIRAAIGNRVDWAEPLYEGPAVEVREDLEQNLIDCDSMVMVFADNAGWARAQLRQFRKLAPRRERPIVAIPVIDTLAEPKPELGFYLSEMVIIDGRNGIGPQTVARLKSSLRL